MGNYPKRIIIVGGADLSEHFSSMFVCKLRVFVSRPIEIVSFLRTNGDHQKLVVDFRRETHSEQKSRKSSRVSSKKVRTTTANPGNRRVCCVWNQICSFFIFFLGIALMWTAYGKVYNGTADDGTHDDILNLSIVYFLWCWGLVVGRVAARVLRGVSRASLCTLPLLFWCLWSGRSSEPRLELNESTRLSSDRGVSCACRKACDQYSIIVVTDASWSWRNSKVQKSSCRLHPSALFFASVYSHTCRAW